MYFKMLLLNVLVFGLVHWFNITWHVTGFFLDYNFLDKVDDKDKCIPGSQ